MKNRTLLGAVMALVLSLTVVVPVYGASAAKVPPVANTHPRITPPLKQGMTLMISGSGTAFNISDQSQHQSASISLTVKVDRVSFGRATLSVTGGTMTIGSETFTVSGGHGILNFHSDKMLLHVHFKDSKNRPMHMILFGEVKGQIPSTLNVESSFNVDFVMHQSKLAGKWFLEFPGATVTRSS